MGRGYYVFEFDKIVSPARLHPIHYPRVGEKRILFDIGGVIIDGKSTGYCADGCAPIADSRTYLLAGRMEPLVPASSWTPCSDQRSWEPNEGSNGYILVSANGGINQQRVAVVLTQEDVVAACNDYGIKVTLFHGRGGSIGRGGGPTYLAIQSQPPGSVMGTLRSTEQGEMVEAKFGLPQIAVRQLEIYTTAVLLATLRPPLPPRDENWQFLTYFAEATPEAELGFLNIGSRPARRKNTRGIGHLRAIPWVFAWTQTRFVLPAWLGVGAGLKGACEKGHREELKAMYKEWPFFQSTIDLIEMVLGKADTTIAKYYDEALVSEERQELGRELRNELLTAEKFVLVISGHEKLQ
ncbi:unnamed protein product [Trifolium pratense]|uniref:Uncharacterized protein n=1 Tax=Trifolium pratense TaxID=57577 RepID=A0ACB0JHN5_TRIPR|nr:unnamed protein product [Trifolium pratense]